MRNVSYHQKMLQQIVSTICKSTYMYIDIQLKYINIVHHQTSLQHTALRRQKKRNTLQHTAPNDMANWGVYAPWQLAASHAAYYDTL